MAESIIFKGSSGLNNKIDPLRHPYNSETGIGSLSEVVNCDIDDTGMISRRLGQVELSALAHSVVFCDGGDCFTVQERTDDSAIYQVGTDFSLTGVRSSLVKGARIGFVQNGDKTYYSSDYQNGVIEGGVSLPWPTEEHVGVNTAREFYPAPLGPHLDVWLARMWIAEGKVLWPSEPYAFGKFNKARYFFQFGTDIRMIKSVAGGMWVSDGASVGFIRKAEKFADMSFEKDKGAAAHEFSANIQLVDLSKSAWQIPGKSAIWSSDDGLTVGTETGEVIVLTEDKLYYPTGGSGSTIVVDGNIINSIW